MSEWYSGRMDSASAALENGTVVVRVAGTLPAPCFDVKLGAYAHDPRADIQLGLYWRPRQPAWADEPTPFTIHAAVDVRGMRNPTVRIYDANGFLDLPVEADPPEGSASLPDPPS